MSIKSVKPTVTIGFVNFNTWHLTKLCLDSIFRFTKLPFKLIVVDNGSIDESIKELIKLHDSGRLNLITHKQDIHDFGSIGHSKALDQMMQHIDTDYTLIFDSDCIALRDFWLRDLLNELNAKVKAVGAKPFRTVDNIGMIHANCLLFETNLFFKYDLTFRPIPEKNIDTGGLISIGLVKAGYSLKYVDWLNIYDKFPCRFFYGVRCAEYVLDNKPIWSHFGRGTSKGKSACDYESELKKWFSISQKIIYE